MSPPGVNTARDTPWMRREMVILDRETILWILSTCSCLPIQYTLLTWVSSRWRFQAPDTLLSIVHISIKFSIFSPTLGIYRQYYCVNFFFEWGNQIFKRENGIWGYMFKFVITTRGRHWGCPRHHDLESWGSACLWVWGHVSNSGWDDENLTTSVIPRILRHQGSWQHKACQMKQEVQFNQSFKP